MSTKCTEDLLEQLSNKKTSFESFVKESKSDFISPNYKKFWFDLMEKLNLSKADIINKADIGYTYFYDIIRGDKSPTRDKLIRIFLAMGLDLKTCQQALKMYGWSELYARNERDSAIIYAINNEYSVSKLNELLNKNKFDSLK